MAEEKKPEVAEELALPGQYMNAVRIRHSQDDFVFDIGQLMPEAGIVQLFARFISSPTHTKRFLEALKISVEKYEKQFGSIPITPPEPKPGKPEGTR